MKIVIVGAGGHGRVVLDILRNSHQFDVAGFLDANAKLRGAIIDNVEVIGDLSALGALASRGIGGAIVAIGDNHVRLAYAQTLEKAGIPLVSAIHPSANIADNARIGKNVVIAQGVNICTHAVVEDSAICNTGSIIEHECQIHPGAHICPGVRLAGHVRVSRGVFIGIGATVIQNLTLGESAVVGAGAVVVEDVPSYATVVGVPARIVSTTHLPGAVKAPAKDTPVPAGDHATALERAMTYRPRRKAPAPAELVSQA